VVEGRGQGVHREDRLSHPGRTDAVNPVLVNRYLNVVDVRPTNHTGSVGTGGNGGGRTVCYTIRLSGAVNASIFKCMAT
ncbi:hypothetical protein ACSZNS_20570, partial [Aeromonas caviae]